MSDALFYRLAEMLLILLSLFINPRCQSRCILTYFFRLEPEFEFSLGGFRSIGSVADVSSYINAVVTSDGSRKGISRVGGT
jgi:hypothetical protein